MPGSYISTRSFMTTSRLTAPDYAPPMKGLQHHEKEALAAVIAHFSRDGFKLPVKADGWEAAPLSDREMMWMSQETIMRFYTSVTRKKGAGTPKGIKTTIERLEKTIVWRRENRVDDVEHVAREADHELKSGCRYLIGFTNAGMPICYYFPLRNKVAPSNRTIMPNFYILDRAADLMTNGQTQTLIIFSFLSDKHGPSPTMSHSKAILDTFYNHYPEVNGGLVFLDVPWYIRGFLRALWPFFEPATKAKMMFPKTGRSLTKNGIADAGDILKDCGGELDLSQDNETYPDTLLQLCLERREEHLKAWLALGNPMVGREERLFKEAYVTRSELSSPTSSMESQWQAQSSRP